MTAPTDADRTLSEELGFDVTVAEAELDFQLELLRLHRGEPAQRGYVLLEREHHSHAAVVYPTPEAAATALEGSELIDDLVAEDCLDAHVPGSLTLADLAGREIIIAN